MASLSSLAAASCVGAVLGVAYLGAAQSLTNGPPAINAGVSISKSVASSTAAAAPVATDGRTLLDEYCVTCHNQRRKTAGLMLDKMDVEHVDTGVETWEKVVWKLRTQTMPPPGVPRPEPIAAKTFATWLETELDRTSAAHPNPGRPFVHRLNRTEYANAIRDLLALNVDGKALLPSDETGYGFDNIAGVLSMSPGLLDRYMIAARKISRLAIGDPSIKRSIETYRVSPLLAQDSRTSEDLPLGTRGGAALRHFFPLDGDYDISIKLGRAYNNNAIRGLGNREQLDVRLEHTLIKRFAVGGECVGSKEPRCVKPPGIVQVTEYERTADDNLKVRVSAKAGERIVGVAFAERTEAATEGAGPARLPMAGSTASGSEAGDMSIDTIQIEGPFNASGAGDTPSRRQIFVCRPTVNQEDESCARRILSNLARRAYRRPVAGPDVEMLVGFYRQGRRNADFEAGIQFALEALLASPNFLLRVEIDPPNVPPGSAYRISDLELASRLSFFLWSSIPDDELLDLAARRQLHDSAVLDHQVRRMLADRRSTALVTNFAEQWLSLRDLKNVAPDPAAFPDFDDSLREAFQRETELFLKSQFDEDRGLGDLLTANYTYVNERLAKFYGIPNVYGTQFRRVTLTDPNRAGLLGQGSILTVTSYSTRTSPVVRGKWLLENLLGAPPPPPPPNVPALKENGEDGGTQISVRARMEEHRKNPACASCHKRMDPMGFSLENFNAIGKWRTMDAGTLIDATGTFPDGTAFNGPGEFRNALLQYKDQLVHTVSEKLLTYALGRGVEYYDMPAVRAIIREAAPNEYRWSSVILGIVRSTPFQMRVIQNRAPVDASVASTSSSEKR